VVVSICPLPFGASVRDGGVDYKFPKAEPDSQLGVIPSSFQRTSVVKKLIVAAFAMALAAPLLGATAAQALSIGINTGHHGHYRPVHHHRHQVCSYHHHHRSCYWR
jgi:hypothetical protein